MPKHKCGGAAYQGQVQQYVVSSGFFGMGFALMQVLGAAAAEATRIYDRDCPASCDDRKYGWVAYRLASLRAVDITHFHNPTVPVGQHRNGYEIVIEWRVFVSCGKSEQPRVQPPDMTDWADLEDTLEQIYGADWRDKIKKIE
jgi:hypothetical protein